MAGDTFLFFMGRKFGHRVFMLPGFRRIFTPQRILMAEQKVLSNSKFICFTARFLPDFDLRFFDGGNSGCAPPSSFFCSMDSRL